MKPGRSAGAAQHVTTDGERWSEHTTGKEVSQDQGGGLRISRQQKGGEVIRKEAERICGFNKVGK